MKATFLGAARTVTGSCFILEHAGARFAVDCGMHQGNKEIEKRNRSIELYDAKNIDFILITHAHIDHSGLLPALVAKGYKNPIYCTAPTKELLEIMLLDSAHIQEMEAEWANTKAKRKGTSPVNPLYTFTDANRTLSLLTPVEYGQSFQPDPNITVTYNDAGHILGSAFIEVEYVQDEKNTKIVFSGDLGRPEQLIVNDPTSLGCADYLFLESTYGNRDHKDASNSLDELAEAIAYAHKNGEKVIIPAFAVERSQQIIYSLFLLRKQGRLPEDMPVYLDSPLAIRATKIFRNHSDFFDDETQAYIKNGENPLELPNLVFSETREQSQAINESRESAVVISASGMANAGRIKHHLRHNLWRPGASIVFVGYQGVGTPGRKIVNGSDSIKIFGEDITIKAKIFTINGFSGHAGQSEMLDWLGKLQGKPIRVLLVHGEAEVQKEFAALIRDRLGFEVHIPEYMEQLELEAGKDFAPVINMDQAQPHVDWDFLLSDSESLLSELQERMNRVKERSWVDQMDARDQLLDLNRAMRRFISGL